MKRVRASFAALALALAIAACGRGKAPAPSETTITFVGWGAPEERGVIRDAIASFEAAHSDIHVHYIQIPGVGYDYLNKLRLMIVAGNVPDVFYVPDGAFGELVRPGVLLDLEPFIARSSAIKVEDMWPSAVDRYRWNGRRLHEGALHALPKDIGPTVLFYDADLFRARGVPFPDPVTPMTYAEAIAMWHALTYDDAGVHRYGLTSFPWVDAVWSAGAEVLSADRRSWNLAAPVATRAVQWCADLALRERVAPDPTRLGSEGAGGRELFEARLAATHIDGRWMVPRFRRLAFDWDVAPIPVPERGRPSIAWSGSVGLAIGARTKHAAEAFALLEFLAGPEGQALLTRTGLQLPNQRATARTDVFLQHGERPAHAEVFIASAETSRPSPATETPNAFWNDVFDSFVEEVWRGDRTAQDYFPVLTPRIDEALRAFNPEK